MATTTKYKQRQMKLISGYSRIHSDNMNVIMDIIAIIFEFQKFEGIWSSQYKGHKIELQEDDTKAVCVTGYGQSVRAKDSLLRGQIISWELEIHLIDYNCNFLGVISSEQEEFTKNPWYHVMNNAWGIDDGVNTVYMGKKSTPKPSTWKGGKPSLPLQKTFTLKFTADWTKERCKLSIWYNGNLFGNIQDDDGTNYTFLLPVLPDNQDWHPCVTPYNGNAWVKIKYQDT